MRSTAPPGRGRVRYQLEAFSTETAEHGEKWRSADEQRIGKARSGGARRRLSRVRSGDGSVSPGGAWSPDARQGYGDPEQRGGSS